MTCKKFWPVLGLAVGLAACDSPTEPAGRTVVPQEAIIDATNGGASGFYFLPPMVWPRPATPGIFDPTVASQLAVEVCLVTNGNCGPALRRYTTTTGSSLYDRLFALPAPYEYNVIWNTYPLNLDPAKTYRVRVLKGTTQLGFADLDVVTTWAEAQKVDNKNFTAVFKNLPFLIRFRVEKGGALPFLVEDFASYASTAAMLGNSTLYVTSEDLGTEYMSLDAGTGYGSSTRSMKFNFPDRTADPNRCSGIPVRRRMATSGQKDLWIEAYVKFSANFKITVPVEWGCQITDQHADLFGAVLTGSGYNFVNLMALYGSQWSWSYPAGTDPMGATEKFILNNPPTSIFDNTWHRLRFHLKLSSATNVADGAATFWLDDVLMSNDTGVIINRDGIWGLLLGGWSNHGPSQDQSLWWGKISLWGSNPGW